MENEFNRVIINYKSGIVEELTLLFRYYTTIEQHLNGKITFKLFAQPMVTWYSRIVKSNGDYDDSIWTIADNGFSLTQQARRKTIGNPGIILYPENQNVNPLDFIKLKDFKQWKKKY